MILIAAALAAAAPDAAPTKPIPYPRADLGACSGKDDAQALTCRALNAESIGDYAASAAEFEQLATHIGDSDAAARDRAWSAAGNMWIAANRSTEAANALDKALAGKTLAGQQLGMTQLDRARAAEAKGDVKGARTLLREAMATVPADPFLYYFAAVLARRDNDLPGARSSINRALSMAPNSSEVLLEAGAIASQAGDTTAARDYWNKAVAAGPASAAGQAAQANLGQLDVPLTVTNKVAARPNGDGDGPEDKPQE